MKSVIGERLRQAVRPDADVPLRGVLWPASFPDAPRARVPAHALAVLVIVTAVCGAYITFYWADDPQVDSLRAATLGRGLSWMAVPVLLMCLALSAAVRGTRGVSYWLPTALAWAASLFVAPMLILATSVMNDSDYCTANLPSHPLAGHVLPMSLLASPAAGPAVAWIAWVMSRRRARPAALYAVWLLAMAVTVVVVLAPRLRAAQTCGQE